MKRVILSITLLIAATAVAFAQSDKKAASPEQAIREIEEAWAVALVKVDMATINNFTAADWSMVDPEGKIVSKAEADGDLKSGKVKISSFKLDDLKIRVIGDTAIAVGLDTEKTMYDGKDISGQYRFTDVFVKQNGQWKCVATHATRVAAAKK